MFHFEGIMFMAVLCAVRAAATVNVYDDDFESTSLNNINSCDYRECDQRCRRIGFPGGACVGDRCKCDILQNDLKENNIDQSVHGCNYQACDQLCRRMGFPGGACVGDRCKCDNFLRATELTLLKGLSCDFIECKQNCRRMGYPGGGCFDGLCKCDKFEITEGRETKSDEYLNDINYYQIDNEADDVNDDSISKEKMDVCFEFLCDLSCRLFTTHGGVCMNGGCYCLPRALENKTSKSLQYCDVVACNNICHQLHYIGGMCQFGQCKCY